MPESESNNGPEGADNSPSINTTRIQYPANNSFKQSLYIAALDRYLDLKGLVWPVTDKRDGIEFTFDFLHVEDQTPIKILTHIEEKELLTYIQRKDCDDIIFIIDVTNHVQACKQCGASSLNCLPKDIVNAAFRLKAMLFYENALWLPNTNVESGQMWKPVPAYEYEQGWNIGYDQALEDMSDDEVPEA